MYRDSNAAGSPKLATGPTYLETVAPTTRRPSRGYPARAGNGIGHPSTGSCQLPASLTCAKVLE